MNGRRLLTRASVLGLMIVLTGGLGAGFSRAVTRHRQTAGYSDEDGPRTMLAIGVPGEDIGDTTDAGAVNLLYEFSTDDDQFWQQDIPTAGAAEAYDAFGSALAGGDFDGDGYMDLAVGVPGQDVNGKPAAGAVHILYSDSGTLSEEGDEIWHQGVANVEGGVEAGDSFGHALAAGDFDSDGYDDLAVGVPREDKGSESETGAVNVLYGSPNGLSAAGNQIWDQDHLDGYGTQPGDRFGWALAVGYLDDDEYADLAVGAPYDDVEGTTDEGVVSVLGGGPGGLSGAMDSAAVGSQIHLADGAASNDRAEGYAGLALAVGDFDGSGVDDLAVGAPGITLDAESGAGWVMVAYHCPVGMDVGFFHQQGPALEDEPGADDGFGSALAVGDFDRDGHDDLAVGVPGEDLGSDPPEEGAGAVHVLYGAGDGLSGNGSQFVTQGSRAEAGDGFGHALAAGDLDLDGYDDLAIGAPRDEGNVGSVTFQVGTESGLTSVYFGSAPFISQDTVSGVPEDGDGFGYALAAIPPVTEEIFLPLVLRDA